MYFFMRGGRRFVLEAEVLDALVGDGGARLLLLLPPPAVEMESPSIRLGNCWDMVTGMERSRRGMNKTRRCLMDG